MTLKETVERVVKVLCSCKQQSQYDNTLVWGVDTIVNSAKLSTTQDLSPQFSRRRRVEKLIPPRVVSCKLCGGEGVIDGEICHQCNGSGRVVVTSEIITYITPFKPRKNFKLNE